MKRFLWILFSVLILSSAVFADGWDRFIIGDQLTKPLSEVQNYKVCYSPEFYNDYKTKDELILKALYIGYVIKAYPYMVISEKAPCRPLKFKDYGEGQNSCRIGYTFAKGSPLVVYIGATDKSENSRTIYPSCNNLITRIKNQYPKTVLLPIVQRNMNAIENYYNR